MNNLSDDCEFLFIQSISKPLINLPIGIKEIRLYKPKKKVLNNNKIPWNCDLYINDKLTNKSI